MLSEQQQRILGYFIEEAKDHLNTIEQGLLNLQNTIADPEMVSELFRAAHSVKGGAAMLGLDCIQQTAHKLEDYFKVLKECPIKVDQKLETLFLRIFDTLQELLEQLQGPFGLTDDKANEVMSEAKPVFGSLQEHLSFLVAQSGSVPPEDVDLTPAPPVAAPRAVIAAESQRVNREESALQLIFQSDVPAQLRDMLKLFKQADLPNNRQQLQDICLGMGRIGEQFDLPAWCELLETARQAIGNLDNTYRTLAPIVIKDIKQAQELVLLGRTPEVAASSELIALTPALPEVDLVDTDFADLLAVPGLADELDAPELFDFTSELESQELTLATEAAIEGVEIEDLFAEPLSSDAQDNLFDALDFGTAPASDFTAPEEDEAFTDALQPSAAQAANPNGPEVGIAELNSLADLFEGDVPDLGMTWQEEILDEDTDSLSESLDLDASSDFSDLLFAPDTAASLNLDDDDLSGLLNRSELANPAEVSQTALPSEALDELLDPDFLPREPIEVDESDFAGFFMVEEIEVASPPSELPGLADSDSDLEDNLDELFGSLEETSESPLSEEAATSADLDDLVALGALFGETEAESLFGEEKASLFDDSGVLDLQTDNQPLESESDLTLDSNELPFDWQEEESTLDLADVLFAAEPEPHAVDVNFDAVLTSVDPTATPLDAASINDFADQVELWSDEPQATLLPDEESQPRAGEEATDLWSDTDDTDIDITADLWDSVERDAASAIDLEGLTLDQISEEALFELESDLVPTTDSALQVEPEALFNFSETEDSETEDAIDRTFEQLLEQPDDALMGLELEDDWLTAPEAPAQADVGPTADNTSDWAAIELPNEALASSDSSEPALRLFGDEDEPLTSASLDRSDELEVDLGDLFEESSSSDSESDSIWGDLAEPLPEASQLEDLDLDSALLLTDALPSEETAEDADFLLSLNFDFEDAVAAEPEPSLSIEEVSSTTETPDLSDSWLDADGSDFDLLLSDTGNADLAADQGLSLADLSLEEVGETADFETAMFDFESAEPMPDATAAPAENDSLGLDALELTFFESDEATPLTDESIDNSEAIASVESIFGTEPLDFDASLDFEAPADSAADQSEIELGSLFEDEAASNWFESDSDLAATEGFDLDELMAETSEADSPLEAIEAEPTPSNRETAAAFDDLDALLGDDLFADTPVTSADAIDDEMVLSASDDLSDLDALIGENTGATELDVTSAGQDFDEFEALLSVEPDSLELFEADATSSGEEGDFDDLDALLGGNEPAGEAVTEAAIDDFDDLDALLTEAETSADTSDEAWGAFSLQVEATSVASDNSDFSDLDALLGGEAAVTEAQAANDFSDLDALLDEDATPSSISGFNDEIEEEDDFSDLEALLGNQPAASPASNATAFDDLEKLLENADQTLGGSPTTRSTRRSALTPKKRSPGVLNDQTMRVSVKNLDNLNNLVGELVVNRNSLEQAQERLRQFLDNLLYQVQQLSDVGQRMRDLYERSLLESSLLSSRRSYQLSSQGVSNTAQTNHSTGASFDALEMDRFTGFHTLSQEMIELIVRVRESASDIDFVVDESDQVTRMFRQVTTQLQEGLTRSRMVPFDQTAARLPRAVRDISVKCGKQAELAIEGKETLIDKMILEQLYDPMTHLVNNAITHGIETPEERRAAGKSAAGRITVRAFHQGNQTVISVTDDGAGIDPEKVKRKAIEKGLITAAEAREMTRLDVYDLLFHHGFSTKDKADDFAGRGVGMDVVRTSLNEIRGAINIDSTVGKGTTFVIRLPLTLSISKALCCISNRARIAFPMDGVEDMLDVPKDRIQTDAEGRACIQWRDSLLPFQPLSELLKYNRSLGRGSVYGGNQEEDMVSVVVLRSNAGSFLALQVDQVLGEQEIVIKQLEGPAPKPIGVAGATVLGDGRIMPIADVLELIDLSMGRIRREPSSSLWEKADDQPPAEPPVVKSDPTVLIVDDSITVRELLSMTFNKVGYRVEQARDGQEAWEKLRSGLPCDLVFCDIEMPRMDGLELLSRIQKDTNLSHLPIAMLTSRGADRHRQMAVQLGAKGYFTKPYLEEALLDAAQRMLKGEVLVGG